MAQPTLQSSIRRLPNGLHEIRLQGQFYHPHWLAFLLRGLSLLKVSVVSGQAAQSAPQEWVATLVLDFRHSGAIPEQLDYHVLTAKPASMDASPVQLGAFQITRRLDQTLDVYIQAADQLGFIGRLLAQISLLGLYPSEVNIDTVAGRISDRIRLKGFAGAPPNEAQQESLNAMLRGLQG